MVDAYAENILMPKISQISGVGLVGIGGQQKPGDPRTGRPAGAGGRGISLEDVRTVLGEANVDLPKGTLNSPRQTFTLNTNDQLLNPDAYNNLIIAYRNGSPVRIRDIGQAIDAPEERLWPAGTTRSAPSFWRSSASPAPTSSRPSTASRRCCRSSKRRFPPAIKVAVLSDRTQTIRASVSDVQFTLLLIAWPGRHGDIHVPAQFLGHRHSGHHRAVCRWSALSPCSTSSATASTTSRSWR